MVEALAQVAVTILTGGFTLAMFYGISKTKFIQYDRDINSLSLKIAAMEHAQKEFITRLELEKSLETLRQEQKETRTDIKTILQIVSKLQGFMGSHIKDAD